VDTDTVDSYLRRIGATRPPAPTADALRDLHERHLRTVPFENLSIHLGEPIVLDEDALVAKIVDRRRGGFCFELNGAFAALLRALGYDVTLLSALVHGGDGEFSLPLDHLTLLVEAAGERYLADVGFGSHALRPLRLDWPAAQNDPAGSFLIRDAPHGDVDVVQDGEVSYRVERHPRRLTDFTAACWWHQSSPDSHFTQRLTCSLPTADGRVTLSENRLITTVAGERTETELDTDAEILAAYERHFGIVLDRVPRLGRDPVRA
jgi:N-hydroxyarylamine O-acetyltransferase